MKRLPEYFERKGWCHQEAFREGRVAVYRRWKQGSVAFHYETIVIREQHERVLSTPGSPVMPAMELYPSSEAWGKNGFTCSTFEEAKQKADFLLKRQLN